MPRIIVDGEESFKYPAILTHSFVPVANIGAAIASGSFAAAGMVVVPCSMKTAAGIHSGYSDNLILRAADVTLKEGRPLVLVPRETPLSPIHLRNLYELSMMGVAVVPPMMTFYNGPQTVDDMVTHTVGKILDRLGIPAEYHSWKNTSASNDSGVTMHSGEFHHGLDAASCRAHSILMAECHLRENYAA